MIRSTSRTSRRRVAWSKSKVGVAMPADTTLMYKHICRERMMAGIRIPTIPVTSVSF